MLYGIVDEKKEDVPSIDTFKKMALLYMPGLLAKLSPGEIVIREELSGKNHRKDGKMIIPVNRNRDRSSSFVVFDVPLIQQTWPGEIIVQ